MSIWCKFSQKSKIPSEDKTKRDNLKHTISTVKQLLNNVEYSSEKAAILEYAINVIGRELAYSVPSDMLRDGETPEGRDYTIPLPSSIHPLKGDYSLVGVNVISEPWEMDKFSKAIARVKLTDFHQEYGHYTGEYYKEINLAVITNGKHHLSAAFEKGAGSAKLQVYSLKDAFPQLKTDGAYWYSDVFSPYRVCDYRVAVLYELARIKHDLMLPENVDKLIEKQFQKEINPRRSDAYEQALHRVSCLELEVAVKNYQLLELRGKLSPQELSEKAQQLENRCEKFKKDLDEWSQRHYNAWEHNFAEDS